MLDPRTLEQARDAVLDWLSALEREATRVIAAADHTHFSLAVDQRFTEQGDLIEWSLSAQLVVCPGWKCGVRDNGGIRWWDQWAGDRGLRVLEGSAVRSDEEMAAAAIRAVIPEAQIEKLPQDARRRADFGVVLPDGRSAEVEATMHTDGGRRGVSNVRSRRADSGLAHDWHVVLGDNRFLNDYSRDNAFLVKEVRRVLAEVLARLEHEGFGPADNARIAAICEEEIGRRWRWATSELLESEPPLKISILGREPAGAGGGSLRVDPATSTFHFSRVTDVSALVSAVQQSIDRKLERNQWDGAAESKWLVVVLDEGEAATQLRGVTEFDDALLDFSDITFSGIDEVWVVAFGDGRFTVLRCAAAGSPWRLYRDLDIEPQLEAD
ncbi:MAG: hypothetical protein OXG38_06975 [Chloroflexi bacterium]|nr:hypothetical protein [Chloroflexota bacterium]